MKGILTTVTLRRAASSGPRLHPWVWDSSVSHSRGASPADPHRTHTLQCHTLPRASLPAKGFCLLSGSWVQAATGAVVGDYPGKYFPYFSYSFHSFILCDLKINTLKGNGWFALRARFGFPPPWLGAMTHQAAGQCLALEWCAVCWQGPVGKLIS